MTETDQPPTALPLELCQKEEKILQEAIFALQGINGEFLQFNWAETSQKNQRLETMIETCPPPDYCVLSKLGSGAADALSMIGEAGWLYSRIEAYIQRVKESTEAGAIQRGLTNALVQEMNAYRALLVELQEQTMQTAGDKSHLRQLLISMHLPIRRLHSLAMLTDGLTPQMTGGPLLRALEGHCRHGDTRHAELLFRLLAASARPWFEMLFYWTTQGLLSEKKDFFVWQTPHVPDRDMWRDRYHIDMHHVPPAQILPTNMVQIAFQIGKSINFIRHCLVDGEYSLESLEHEARTCFVYQPSPVDGVNIMESPFCDWLQRTADTVNRHILQSLREQHNLRLHLYCLKQFLLLGQGDFVANLTEALHNEYENHKSIVGIYRHTLSALMEGALRSSNATFLPEDCLQRLQVELRLGAEDAIRFKFGPDQETSNDTRTVWDIFELRYTVPDPVMAIFNPILMDKYHALFHHLFALRKIEHYLNYTWRQSAMLSHVLQSFAQYSAIGVRNNPYYARAVVLLRRIAITRQSMTNFVVNLKSFLMLEVIEGGWKRLERKFEEAESLDALIVAHEDFVEAVCRQSLVYSKDEEIRGAVKDLLDLCDQFSIYQRELFGQALKAADLAAKKRRLADKRNREGEWGFDDSVNSQSEETTFFGLSDASKMQDLDTLSGYFHSTILNLLQALDRKLNGSAAFGIVENSSRPRSMENRNDEVYLSSDEDLRLLRFLRAQLDQNEFYGRELAS